MNKLIYFSILIIVLLSCQDVIDIDPQSEEPRLVVDGLLRVDPDGFVLRLGVKVTETSAFLGEVPATNLKQITLGGLVLQDTANPGSGFYENYFSPTGLKEGGDNLLQIQHKDQRYLARGNYASSAQIEDLLQGPGTNFDDNTQISVTYADDPDTVNFYLIDFGFDNYSVSSDNFYNGKKNTISFIYDRKIEPGSEVTVSVLGIDRSFFNYMSKLIDQSKDEIDLFQTPVSTLRGNIINVTEIDNIDFFDNVNQTNNFALGYFAVAETYTKTIVIE